jgi:hypothetical protein
MSKLKSTTIKKFEAIRIWLIYFGKVDEKNIDYLDPCIYDFYDVQIITDDVNESWDENIQRK